LRFGNAHGSDRNGRFALRKHHHEVAAAQHELGIKFDALTRNADKMLIYKYVVHQVANA